jgi:hypothetical protein
MSSVIQSDHLTYGAYLPESFFVPAFVLRPSDATPPTVSPLLLQQASHLFSFIHAHLSDFLAALVELEGKPDFNYLVAAAIPSLFGYFASREHFKLAYPFYFQVFQATKPLVGFKILYPFLTSPFLFRFFESALAPFVDRLTRDSRLTSPTTGRFLKSITEAYAKDLAGLFTERSRLIPRRVSVLFALLKDSWGMKDAVDLIVHRLFRPLSLMFLRASGRERHSKFVESVFAALSPALSESLVLSLCNCRSLFRIPSLFLFFQQQFLTFYTCVSDIAVLARTMERKLKLPPSLASLCFNDTPITAMFWFKIFPKPPLALPPPTTPLIFRDLSGVDPALAEGARSFEKLLNGQMWLSVLREWQQIAEEHQRIMVMQIVVIAARQARERRYPTIEEAHARASRLFRSRLIKQEQFMTLIELGLSDMGEVRRVALRVVMELWSSYLRMKSQHLDGFEIDLTNRAANAVFWEAVEGLRGIDGDSLSFSFSLLIRSLHFLSALATEHLSRPDLIKAAIVLSQSQRLIKLYLIVRHGCLDCRIFRELCTDSEMFLWCELESVILKMVMEDEVLKEKFFAFQNSPL